MLENNESDNRKELYENFRKQLDTDISDAFYDEDDLVEIYDQASDMEDEYVKLQVLLLAYRLYPHSEAMAARRGYFLWSYNMDEGVDALLKTYSGSSDLIWKILALRASKTSAEDLGKRLEKLLETATDIDDETMIQLVDLASEAGAFDWLKQHEDLLKSKTDYRPTLLYELQIVAIINGDRDYAIAKLEELTELEPFNADYWVILSEEHMNAGNVDAALTAADYALAINSENPEAILSRARAMAVSEKSDPAELLRMVKPLLKSDSTDSRALKIAVAAMLQLNMNAEAVDALTEFIGRCPWDKSVIEYLLVLRYPSINNVLSNYYDALSETENTEEAWAAWGTEKFNEGKYKEAAMILGCYYNHNDLSDENLNLYASALYATGFYGASAVLLGNILENEPEKLTPEVAVTGLLSMLRLGYKEQAGETLKIMDTTPSVQPWSVGHFLRSSGFELIMTRLRKAIKSTRNVNIDAIDPFLNISDPEIDY